MDPIELSWTGFRGFIRETTLRLPRLTLLLGRNNVGKTSAYAPLLLLRQTLDARSPETALLSRGELIDVGPFRDYVSNHDEQGLVRFRLKLFGATPPSARANGRRPASLEVTFRSQDGQDAFLARQRIEDRHGELIVDRRRSAPTDSFEVTSPVLPKSTAGRPRSEITSLRKALRDEKPMGFMIQGYGALVLPRGVREDKQRWAGVQDWYESAYQLYDVQQQTNSMVYRLLSGLSYVGPLRSLPQRTYHLAPEAPLEVGGTGEYAPELLYRPGHEEQREAVNNWLGKLGYGKLHFEQLSPEYFQLQVERPSGMRINVADSGVGLSQVLPLLVQGALADDDSTVIAQQPEIHLNPAQQTIVTDFLVDRAAAGVRIVIESHSEHVLLRLRRRIAEGKIPASEVAIYFVDNTENGTQLKPMSIGESGEVDREEWPTGFFEEQLDDAFALAKAQASKGADSAST